MPDAEIVRHEQAELATTQQPTLMHILQEAVQRGADVGVIERLVTLKERVDRNEAEKAFYEAKARLHAKIPQIAESGVIAINGKVQSRYAKYEDIDLILRPLLQEEGFSIEFDAKWDGDRLAMTGTLVHRQGHRETKSLPLPIDISGNKNKTQAMGSTVSYGRRYLRAMLLDIVTRSEDDDGNGGGNQVLTQEQRDDIELLVKDTKAELAKVLAFAGAQSIAEIRQSEYVRVRDALRKRYGQ